METIYHEIIMTTKTITGIVIHGKALGRTIGFPTANIHASSSDTWLSAGTYGLSGIIRWETYYGIGVFLESEELFEAHFFDFSDDIYDEEISVTPLFKIRENEKFSGIEALKSQIEKDKTVMENWIVWNK